MTLKQACAMVVLMALPAWAGVEKLGEASVRFTGSGPAGFRLEGKTQVLSIREEDGAVAFTVPLDTLETGISLRDRHMREKYLEVGKYPEATLVVPWSALRLPAPGQSLSQKVSGMMTLHGQRRPVQISYELKHSGDHYEASGKVPLNMKEFGIQVPSYMGLTVKPDIEAIVSFHFKKD
ncbi:MAG: YceI family protein [Myxococcaceae bacterium]|nr:YceI family protein [Myxococcaceae bacterium]